MKEEVGRGSDRTDTSEIIKFLELVSNRRDSRAHCSSWMLSLMWMLSIRMWPLVGFSKKPSNTTWTPKTQSEQKLFWSCRAAAAVPGTLWGSGAGWFGPPSSEAPGPLSAPTGGSRPGRCPSAGPSGCPGPPPGAGSGTAGRAGLAPAPPPGSAAGPSSAGCGCRRPGSDSSQKSLEKRRRRTSGNLGKVVLAEGEEV